MTRQKVRYSSDDDPGRVKYYHGYYILNHRHRKYTYVKKGVMKALTPTQWDIIQKIRRGLVVFPYNGKYLYHEGKLYHEVNKRSVEVLLRKEYLTQPDATPVIKDGDLVLPDITLRLTEKGLNHKQTPPKIK